MYSKKPGKPDNLTKKMESSTYNTRLLSTSTNNQLNPYYVTGFSDASQKALVVFGTNLTSTVGVKFSRKQLAIVILVPYTRDIIVGLLLSDGWLTFASKTNKNARLGFAQSGDNSGYFWFVFSILSHYCSSYPIVRNRRSFGKETIGLQFFIDQCLVWLNFILSSILMGSK